MRISSSSRKRNWLPLLTGLILVLALAFSGVFLPTSSDATGIRVNALRHQLGTAREMLEQLNPNVMALSRKIAVNEVALDKHHERLAVVERKLRNQFKDLLVLCADPNNKRSQVFVANHKASEREMEKLLLSRQLATIGLSFEHKALRQKIDGIHSELRILKASKKSIDSARNQLNLDINDLETTLAMILRFSSQNPSSVRVNNQLVRCAKQLEQVEKGLQKLQNDLELRIEG